MRTGARAAWGLWVAGMLGAGAQASAGEAVVLRSGAVAGYEQVLKGLQRSAAGHVVTEVEVPADPAAAQAAVAGAAAHADVLVAVGSLAADVAHRTAPAKPLVYSFVADPDALGLKGDNVAGVAYGRPAKLQFAAFRMLYPRMIKVGVVHGPASAREVEAALAIAPHVRLNIIAKAVRTEQEIPGALRSLLSGDEAVDALWLPPDPLLLAEATRRFFFEQAVKAEKPVFTFNESLVREGAFASDSPDPDGIGETLGQIVKRVLGGETAGQVGVFVPKSDLVVNGRIAKRLNVNVPQTPGLRVTQ